MNEKKLMNFLQVIDDMDVEIACVNETWFDQKEGVFTKKIKDAGFEPHHAYRDGKRGRGVAIIYKSRSRKEMLAHLGMNPSNMHI